VKYHLAGDEVVALADALGVTGLAYLADVDRVVRLYFTAKNDLEPVLAAELLERATRSIRGCARSSRARRRRD
jgi:hypothetical protein